MLGLRRTWPLFALLGVTAVWGWTFVIVRDAVARYPVPDFLALRFALATLLLAPILLRPGRGARAGILPGLVLAASYLTQTEGLRFTTASQAGLLTGLFVVITPLLAVALHRKWPAGVTLFAVPVAFAGTALLASSSGHASNQILGDALEVCTAALLSVHMLLLARVDGRNDPVRVAFGQMAVCFVVFGLGSAGGGTPKWPDTTVWLTVLITGSLASALAFWLQTLVQQRISATRTALILVTEPAFATFFGIVLAGDLFGWPQAFGAALIFTALFAHEIVPVIRPTSESESTVGGLEANASYTLQAPGRLGKGEPDP